MLHACWHDIRAGTVCNCEVCKDVNPVCNRLRILNFVVQGKLEILQQVAQQAADAGSQMAQACQRQKPCLVAVTQQMLQAWEAPAGSFLDTCDLKAAELVRIFCCACMMLFCMPQH